MLSALLVQLFGRDVVDRLVAAGYDNAESIAGAGAERLAEEGEISIALARRVVAVALEDVDESESGDEPISPAAEIRSEGVVVAELSEETAHAPEIQDEPSIPAGHEAGAVTETNGAALALSSATSSGEPDRSNAPTGPGARESISHEEDSAGAGGKHVRRPFRRPHTPLASDLSSPIASKPSSPIVSDPSSAIAAEANTESRSAGRSRRNGNPVQKREPREDDRAVRDKRHHARRQEKRPNDADPFVDDVGLVAWMGTATRQGSAPGGSLSVADEILDPGLPIGTPPQTAGKIPMPPQPWGRPNHGTAGAAAASEAGKQEPAARQPASAAAQPAPVKSLRATQPARIGGQNRVVVEHSFWSFGAPIGPKIGERATDSGSAGKKPASPGPEGAAGDRGGPPSPRRRIHDGH